MPQVSIRLELHNSIIAAVEQLTFTDSAEVLFSDVIKYPENVIENYTASVQFSDTTDIQRNLSDTQRAYGFKIVTGELIEENNGQNDIDIKTDRLAQVEDRLGYFVTTIPMLLTSSSFQIVDTRFNQASYLIEPTDRGYQLMLVFDFDVIVKVGNRTVQ